MSLKQNDELVEIIKEIMQEGFDCAMGGSMFKTAGENEKIQAELYDKAIKEAEDKITHHFSGWKYCEECNKLKVKEFGN